MSVFADILTSEEPRQEIRGERLAQLAGELWAKGIPLPLTAKAVIITETEDGGKDWDYEHGEPREPNWLPAGFKF